MSVNILEVLAHLPHRKQPTEMSLDVTCFTIDGSLHSVLHEPEIQIKASAFAQILNLALMILHPYRS